jgi:hypothetical protein
MNPYLAVSDVEHTEGSGRDVESLHEVQWYTHEVSNGATDHVTVTHHGASASRMCTPHRLQRTDGT